VCNYTAKIICYYVWKIHYYSISPAYAGHTFWCACKLQTAFQQQNMICICDRQTDTFSSTELWQNKQMFLQRKLRIKKIYWERGGGGEGKRESAHALVCVCTVCTYKHKCQNNSKTTIQSTQSHIHVTCTCNCILNYEGCETMWLCT
jgi:hypothetical protein